MKEVTAIVMTDRGVSPPPTKRQRLSTSSLLAPSIHSRPISTLENHMLRVFSWNVNGVAPFLQPSITSFFKPTVSNKEKLGTAVKSSDRESERPMRLSRKAHLSEANHITPDPAEQTGTSPLTASLKRWKYPSVVCLQEVKISPTDTKTQQAVRQAVKHCNSRADGNENEVGYTAHFNLPRDKFNARGFGGKVYGVCTLVRNDIPGIHDVSAQIKMVNWDLEGRVLLLELPEKKIVVFNVYAVNGTENPYRDPHTGTVIGTRHDRKRAFHTELARECKQYEERGWIVVVAGDMNIARSPIDGFPGIRLGDAHVKNRADFERKFMSKNEGLGMLDTFRQLHGEERKYSYRSRGVEWGASCDRVDMIMISRHAGRTTEMSNHGLDSEARQNWWDLLEADILDEELERGPSDHVPIYATLAYRNPNLDQK
jgi:exonuclease III